MSKRKMIAIHEIHPGKKAKPIRPGATFSSEQHERLFESGAAKYYKEPASEVSSEPEGDSTESSAGAGGQNPVGQDAGGSGAGGNTDPGQGGNGR